MFEQAFKNVDDVLRKEAGCTTELDYTEQTSWLLFLKYLDALEEDLADQAALEGKTYAYIVDDPHRWANWAAPKGADGKLDHNTALTGDDLRDFVNQDLFPYLQGFKLKASGPNTIEYKIGEIFGEIRNKIQSGYNMREIIDEMDSLRFRSQAEKHELSHLYEAKIRNMGNAGRNGGEYYTPRPLIRAMVKRPPGWVVPAPKQEVQLGLSGRTALTRLRRVTHLWSLANCELNGNPARPAERRPRPSRHELPLARSPPGRCARQPPRGPRVPRRHQPADPLPPRCRWSPPARQATPPLLHPGR